MKKLIILIAIIFSSNFLAIAQNSDIYFLLEKAGKQRMLCEQMTKNYLMIVTNQNADLAKIEIDQTKIEFNENLNFLFRNLNTDLTKKTISEISDKWLDLKDKIDADKNVSDCNIVLELSENLSLVCNNLTNNIYRENDFKNARMINILNKQKLNSQKLIKFLLINNLENNDRNLTIKNINEVIASYELNNQLLKGLTNTEINLKNLLSKNSIEWTLIKQNFDINNTKFKIEIAIENANKILKLNNDFSNSLEIISLTNSVLTKR